MTRKKRCRGESVVSYFIVIGLIVLVCFTVAQRLGMSKYAVLVGTQAATEAIGSSIEQDNASDPDE